MPFPELSMYIQCLEKKKKTTLKKKASSPHQFKEKYARETNNFFCSALRYTMKSPRTQIFLCKLDLAFY